jgi:hypothetical protein
MNVREWSPANPARIKTLFLFSLSFLQSLYNFYYETDDFVVDCISLKVQQLNTPTRLKSLPASHVESTERRRFVMGGCRNEEEKRTKLM